MYTNIIGADSETYHGEPITFQFVHEHEEFIFWLKNPKDALGDFLKCLDRIGKHYHRDTQHVIYCHNLAFDMVSFFHNIYSIFYDTPKFTINYKKWKIEGLYGAPCFASFKKDGSRTSFMLVDSYAWFQTSLAKLGQLVCPNLPKLTMPSKLGKHRYKPGDRRFEEYAMRDSVISYYAGKKIQEFHKLYDVPQCVSAPNMAAKIFRKHFLKERIPLPPRKIMYAALSSYHGGKNNITVKPGFYPITSLDIKSAYPAQMIELPSFSVIEAYKIIKGRGHPNCLLPKLGVYRVSGEAKPCKWPVIFNHNFKPVQGSFKNIWITGAELNEALISKEIIVNDLEGYYYDTNMDFCESPFKAYVEDFFHRKETAEDEIYRTFFKIMINSLYGKFIQNKGAANLTTGLSYDLDNNSLQIECELIAGGLFHPFIATSITGGTRADIHHLEHNYNSAHTSTDGIFSLNKFRYFKSDQIGSLSVEAKGTAAILRNKLYIIYGDKQTEKNFKSSIYKGKFIDKYALHGFNGKVFDLEELIASGKRSYQYEKVNTLRESVRRGLVVNDFVKRTGTLNIGES